MNELQEQPHIQQVTAPIGRVLSLRWKQESPPPHEFLAIACPEEEGGFSIFAAHIPGVISQAETVDEAKAHISEAFMGMLEACRKRGEPLPYSYQPVVETTPGCQRLWISVYG
jgi:predicted RNase H-like HicB family nuclease